MNNVGRHFFCSYFQALLELTFREEAGVQVKNLAYIDLKQDWDLHILWMNRSFLVAA